MVTTVLRSIFALLLVVIAAGSLTSNAEAADKTDVLRRENLVAWCIVPFDAKKRGPAERAAMLKARRTGATPDGGRHVGPCHLRPTKSTNCAAIDHALVRDGKPACRGPAET